MSPLATPFNISPHECNKTRRQIKDRQIGKKEIKLSSFTDNMVINIENNKQTERIKELYQGCRKQVNIEKSIAFLYISDIKWNVKLKTQYHLHHHNQK